MDKLSSSIARFKSSCPYLATTKNKTLRSLSTSAHTRYPSISRLTYKATKCPVMGPALVLRSYQGVQAAGYASVAGRAEVEAIHKKEGVHVNVGGSAGIEACPHAALANEAARRAASLSQASNLANGKSNPASTHGATGTSPYSVPSSLHAANSSEASTSKGVFNYTQFYNQELDKKHKDKSYRYFNNINRLAAKFPVAHTARVTDEVDVWCSNDYLGMGRNPVVLETMQCVLFF